MSNRFLALKNATYALHNSNLEKIKVHTNITDENTETIILSKEEIKDMNDYFLLSSKGI
jgi:hypothetical protein